MRTAPAAHAFHRSYLFMIHQRAHASAKWSAYLRSIPQQYTDPLWWPEAAVAAVEGTTLHGAIRDRKEWLLDAYRSSAAKLVEAAPDEFPPSLFTMYSQ